LIKIFQRSQMIRLDKIDQLPILRLFLQPRLNRLHSHHLIHRTTQVAIATPHQTTHHIRLRSIQNRSIEWARFNQINTIKRLLHNQTRASTINIKVFSNEMESVCL
jgi:hypothetical protein